MTYYESLVLKLPIHLGLLSASDQNMSEISKLCQHCVQSNISEASKCSGKSQDSVIFLVLAMAKDLANWNGKRFNLLTHKDRVLWEKEFIKKLNEIETKVGEVKNAFDSAVRDETFSIGALNQMLHGGQNKNSLMKVRSRVTVDSLLEWLISSNKKDICPTLIDFLQNMDLLEQLEHLPEILELQHFLVETFSGRIALSDIENMTIHEICSKIDV